MTVATTVSRQAYTTTIGQTVFPFTFPVINKTDLVVTFTPTGGASQTLTLNVDYSVTGEGTDTGGNVTLSAGASAGQLVIQRIVPYTQPTDYKNQGSFYPATIERSLDRAAMQVQQLSDSIGRTLRFPITTDPVFNAELPLPTPAVLFGTNAGGTGMRSYTPQEIASIVAYGNWYYDRFTATASQTVFTLSADPAVLGNLDVSIDGVTQVPIDDYTIAGTTLTMTAAMVGGERVLVRYGTAVPAGDGGAGLWTPAGTGAVQRTVQSKLREVVSVKDFGAVGDGVTDDTAAFNSMTAYIRTLLQASLGGQPIYNVNVHIPPGSYSVSSWDLTALLGRSINIQAHGATLVGRTAAKVVVDCTGSRWLRFHGLKVVGINGTAPLCAIQIGPAGTETCGNNTFNDVECLGFFSRAAFCNLGSETTQHFGCTYLNRTQTAGVYAFIGDGLTQFVPQSDYVTITRTGGTAVSFTNNGHYAAQIRNEGGGDALFLANTSNWVFDQNTYFLSFNGAAVRLYATNLYRNGNLTLNGLFESSQDNQPVPGNTGIKYLIVLDGDGTSTAIAGLYIRSGFPHVDTSVFHKPSAGTYRISNAVIEIHSLQESSAVFFSGTTAGLSLDGVIATRDAAKLNLGAIDKFNGQLRLNDAAALLSAPVAGGYIIHSESDSTQSISGTTAYTFTEANFTPAITFATPGDLSVSYSVQQGRYYKVGKLVHFELSLTFTPTYTTASGEFRVTGLPVAGANDSIDNALGVGTINTGFTWPASTTQCVPRLPSNSSQIRIYSFGSGTAATVWTVSNVPSGTAKSILISGSYLAAT